MTTPAQPPARRAGNKFPSLRSPVTWVVVLGIGLAAGAFILYRRNKASSAANAATATAATPNNEDVAGQIATLQGEIGDLQSTSAQDEAAETGTQPLPPVQPGGGSGPPPTGTPIRRPPAMPASVHGSAASPTSIRLSWAKVAGATSYQAHTTYQGKAGPVATTSGTSVTISGLTPSHTYTAHVKACNGSGCSAETNGPVVKTPR